MPFTINTSFKSDIGLKNQAVHGVYAFAWTHNGTTALLLRSREDPNVFSAADVAIRDTETVMILFFESTTLRLSVKSDAPEITAAISHWRNVHTGSGGAIPMRLLTQSKFGFALVPPNGNSAAIYTDINSDYMNENNTKQIGTVMIPVRNGNLVTTIAAKPIVPNTRDAMHAFGSRYIRRYCAMFPGLVKEMFSDVGDSHPPSFSWANKRTQRMHFPLAITIMGEMPISLFDANTTPIARLNGNHATFLLNCFEIACRLHGTTLAQLSRVLDVESGQILRAGLEVLGYAITFCATQFKYRIDFRIESDSTIKTLDCPDPDVSSGATSSSDCEDNTRVTREVFHILVNLPIAILPDALRSIQRAACNYTFISILGSMLNNREIPAPERLSTKLLDTDPKWDTSLRDIAVASHRYGLLMPTTVFTAMFNGQVGVREERWQPLLLENIYPCSPLPTGIDTSVDSLGRQLCIEMSSEFAWCVQLKDMHAMRGSTNKGRRKTLYYREVLTGVADDTHFIFSMRGVNPPSYGVPLERILEQEYSQIQMFKFDHDPQFGVVCNDTVEFYNAARKSVLPYLPPAKLDTFFQHRNTEHLLTNTSDVKTAVKDIIGSVDTYHAGVFDRLPFAQQQPQSTGDFLRTVATSQIWTLPFEQMTLDDWKKWTDLLAKYKLEITHIEEVQCIPTFGTRNWMVRTVIGL